ncbi:hypothetical protein GJ700_05710 [Duganella sp. FT92W]|uniref:Uncharacterized protein n=1 Tax=Pseudoduganella rivuli TaxID=2666085 RepID=A0A7X2IJY0_9BURK|nr:hypothetical protein [Pseudoduganella rivuli]MRV71214.1 hypothetical protein [Pseudoduganella rivuli]
MKLFSSLMQALRNDPWLAFPSAAIAVAGLLDLRLPAAMRTGVSPHLLQAAAALMLYLSSSASTRLAETAQILGQRRIPDALWHDSVKLRLASVWANGFALLIAIAVPWIISTTMQAPVLAALAALSLAACAGTLFATLRSGLLPRLRNRTVYTAGMIIIVVWAVYGDVAVAALMRLPATVLVLLAAGWPAMSVALQRYWRIMPRVQPPATAAEAPAWSSKVLRYSLLQPRFLQDNKVQSSMLGGVRMGTAALCWSLTPPLPLGSVLTVGHLLAMIAWIPAAMSMVAMRNLHWRTLLAPGRDGALAMQIYRTSLKIAVCMLLVLMFGQAALDMAFGQRMADTLHNMEKWLVFGMQAPLLVAINVLLCALPNPRRTTWGTLMAAYLVLALIHVGKLYSVPVTGLHAGLGYAAGMIVLSVLVMRMASRLWTPNRLLPYLPERPVSLTAFSAAR